MAKKKRVLWMYLLTILGVTIFIHFRQRAAMRSGAPKKSYAKASYPTSYTEEGTPVEYSFDETILIGEAPLIKPDKAQNIVNLFRSVYPELGSPRILVHVDRHQVDEPRLMARLGIVEHARDPNRNIVGLVKKARKSVYGDGEIKPTTTDAATAREVENLFTRPFRAARALVVPPQTAADLIGKKPVDDYILMVDTPAAQIQREVFSRGADVAIEVMISWRNETVSSIGGDQTITVPDMAATAISLRTAKIIGDATSAEVTGRVPLSRLATYDVRQIAEATALALMKDIAINREQ